MPASGKSTVGVLLAKRLGLSFVDTDILIQEQEKRLLKDIIAEEGLEGFMEVENQVNRDIQVENAVIAPGGSVVYGREAMEHLKAISTVVYLKLERPGCGPEGWYDAAGSVRREGSSVREICGYHSGRGRKRCRRHCGLSEREV